MIRSGDTNTDTEPDRSAGLRPVEQMSAEECQAELRGEQDIHRLRSIVGARRLLLEMHKQGITGKLEADVQAGRVRHWRYPRSLKVS